MTITLNSCAASASTTEASSAFSQFVLRQIECAKLRAELTVNQTDMALSALSAGLISPETAILILAETGVEVSSDRR
jgi:hypothetical protein